MKTRSLLNLRNLLALPLLALPFAVGCSTEHVYSDGYAEGVQGSLVAEVFGDVGVLRGIDNQFVSPEQRGLFELGGLNDGKVDRDGDQVWANLVAEHPQGRVYLDVTVVNVEAMEPGVPYTAVVDGYESSGGGAYVSGDADVARANDPGISVYACPETLTGSDPGSSSGDAEEITVTKEVGPSGRELLRFDAVADNDEQSVFLDGWITAQPNGV